MHLAKPYLFLSSSLMSWNRMPCNFGWPYKEKCFSTWSHIIHLFHASLPYHASCDHLAAAASFCFAPNPAISMAPTLCLAWSLPETANCNMDCYMLVSMPFIKHEHVTMSAHDSMCDSEAAVCWAFAWIPAWAPIWISLITSPAVLSGATVPHISPQPGLGGSHEPLEGMVLRSLVVV